MKDIFFLLCFFVGSILGAQENGEKGGPKDEIFAKLSKAKQSFFESKSEAQKSVLADLDKSIESAKARGSLESVEKLNAEKKSFTQKNILPSSVSTSSYERKLRSEMKKLEAEYEDAIKEYVRTDKIDLAKDLRAELMDLKNVLAGQLDPDALAEFEIEEGGEGIGLLQNGNKPFSNRGYTWIDIPKQIPFTKYVIVSGGGKTPLRLKVTKSGWIYVTLSSEEQETIVPYLEKESWESAKLQFAITAKGKPTMYVFRKRFPSGKHEIPRLNFSGPIPLMP